MSSPTPWNPRRGLVRAHSLRNKLWRLGLASITSSQVYPSCWAEGVHKRWTPHRGTERGHLCTCVLPPHLPLWLHSGYLTKPASTRAASGKHSLLPGSSLLVQDCIMYYVAVSCMCQIGECLEMRLTLKLLNTEWADSLHNVGGPHPIS